MQQPLSCWYCLIIKFVIIPECGGNDDCIDFSYVTPHLDLYESQATVKSDIQYIS